MGNIIYNKIQPLDEYDEYDNIFVLCLDKMEKGTLNYNSNISILSNVMNNKCNYCNLNVQYICKNKWIYDKTNKNCDSCNNINMYSSV